jgi:Asp-tRNA(Asn)/Glu-tRNA(Gln) amidotransferase A subunit family amidase
MPSVSIPIPLPGPLPIGLEVICPKGQDTLALQAAQHIAEILNQKI